jgi:hypothetical protein
MDITIEEISIFSNSSHLEWRVGLSDTIVKGTIPRTIPARFGLIWSSVIFSLPLINLVQRFQRKRFKCDLLSKYA